MGHNLTMKHIQRMLLALLFLGLLSSCKHWWDGSQDEDQSPFQGVPPKELYSDAKKSLNKKQYTEAIKKLEALETLYPFNDYAEEADMDLIYAYYKKDDFSSASATAEHFIHLYPRSKHVDYAYYMKGLSDFNQTRGNLANILPLDRSQRDPGTQSQAYSDFASLVQRFPNSRYAANALQRMVYLRNMFAQRELNASLYYYHRQMYVAAEERAIYLIKTYPQSLYIVNDIVLVYLEISFIFILGSSKTKYKG